MIKKIWENPEIRILDIKKDTAKYNYKCPSNSGIYKPPHPHPWNPWWWWPW